MPILSFTEKIHEGADVYTFRFKKPTGFKHKAGQHALFVLPGFYRPHPFTISSAPDEDFVSFTTHAREGSAFKRRIMEFVAGNKVFLLGPLLNFTFHKTYDEYVFLAQGIGITPFRSMLVHANAANMPVKTTLIHVDGAGHTFKALTSEYATEALYPTNPEEFRDVVLKQDSAKAFYLSGSPRFVKATKALLKEHGVARKNIRTDSFLGY